MNNITSHSKLRAGVVAALGGRCVRCGFSDPRALQIDHVNGDGASDRAKHGGANASFFKAVLTSICKEENKYQLLCANCNWIKRSERGEHNGGVQRDEESDGYGNRKYLN